MILNGKAKEDFSSWFISKYLLYYNDYVKKPTIINSLIIEWFDSVGIYINIQIMQNPVSHKVYFEYLIRDSKIRMSDFYTSRQEATQQAIIKANDIYNERFK